MKLLFILMLSGCAIPPTNKKPLTYKEKINRKIENCIIKMLREGVGEMGVYPICNGIYRKRTIRTVPRRRMGEKRET